MGAILSCPTVAFDWRDGGAHVPYGFTAQDMENSLPDAVSVSTEQNTEGMKAVDMQALIVHLFRALRQMNSKIDRLEAKETEH